MFNYIIQGWYVLTIVLIAAIVGYIVYYALEWFAMKRARRLSFSNSQQQQPGAEEEPEAIVIDEIAIITTVDEKGEEETFVVEEEIIIENKSQEETSVGGDENAPNKFAGFNKDDIMEIHPEESADQPQTENSFAQKKHKVKNIAEGMTRDDILQDKHDKNLQKVKYEALLCKQRNDLAGYEKKLIEGLILDPDDIDIFRQLADFYFSEGKYTKALSMFRKILTFDANDHHALWQIGEIYIEQGQYEDAQVFIEKALFLSPDNPKYYISLVDINIAKNELQQALVYLEKIVALRPRNIPYLMALGEMYEKLGRAEEAKQTYFRVLEIDPLHIDVKHILKRF